MERGSWQAAARAFRPPLAHDLVVEEITEVVLTGRVTERCVLHTALDAHVRHGDVTVLADAVVSAGRGWRMPA